MTDTATLDIQPGRLFIGGEWQDAASGETFDTINPATAETLTHVAAAAAEDVDRAVKAARTAFEADSWQKLDARKRGKLLYAIADKLEERADELARLETMDNGKPVREARMIDIKESIDCFRYYAGWADKISGDVIPVPGPYLNYTRREPVGVCGAIIPWNYPLQMAAWKVAPAIACGNTVVLEARGADAADGAGAGPRGGRGGAAGRRAERADGLRRAGGRGAGEPPGRGQDRVHGLHGGRQDHPEAGGGHAEEGVAGAGRQEPQHRAGRRGHRRGGQGRVDGHLLQHGPGVHGREPPAGAREDPRRVRGEAGEARGRLSSPATRWTPRRAWGRW